MRNTNVDAQNKMGHRRFSMISFILNYLWHQHITQDAQKRIRAANAIEDMTEDSLYRIALSGDHGEVGLMALRKWEPKDRDPAAEMSDIRALMEELENLFLKGTVLCVAPPGPPSGALAESQSEIPAASKVFGTNKTATQIVHEQLTEGFQIRYGKKLHVVHTRPSHGRHVLVEAMAEMKVAVEATLDRLEAEFFRGDMRRALCAFNVSHYSSSMLRLFYLTPDEGGAHRQTLMENLVRWRMLGKALHLPEVQPQDVIIALRCALSQRERLLASSGQGKPDAAVDNRATWLCAIVDALWSGEQLVAGAFKRLMPLFAALFALDTGTNSAERGLGRHARHRDVHPGARESEISWSEVTFEVHEDGPSDESVIASQSTSAESRGDLLMTDFSRQCARLWKALHGGRFCCYKQRKNKGITGTGWRQDGSMKVIKEGQRRALKALGSGHFHSKETVCGRKRTHIVDDACERAEQLVPSKALENFKKRSAVIMTQRLDLKTQIKNPTSITAAVSKLRSKRKVDGSGKGRGKGKVDGSGKGRGTGKVNPKSVDSEDFPMLPKLKAKEVIVVDDDGETNSNAVPKYLNAGMNQLRNAAQIAVAKVVDLDTHSGDDLSALLRVWTLIVKEGKRVREVGSKDTKVTKFAPRKTQHCKLHFSESFRAKHQPLIESCTGTEGNWVSHTDSEAPPAQPRSDKEGDRAVYIDRLDDYRRFLIGQRTYDAKCFGPISRSRLLGMA